MRSRLLVSTIFIFALVICAVPAIAGDAAGKSETTANTKSNTGAVIDSFLKSIEQSDKFEAEKRKQALAAIEEFRSIGGDLSPAISEALSALYPEYQEALIQLAEENYESAITTLKKLVASENEFLAADATYFLARAYMAQEKYEQAAPLLEELSAKWKDKTLQQGNALFLTAVAQAEMLDRKAAIKSFEKFLKEHPDAPERMKVGAFRQLEQLKYIEEGSLGDAYHRMVYSRRRLALADSGEKTRAEQNKIISMLDKLIKEAEEKECNCRGGGQGQGQQNQGGGQANGKGEGSGKNGQGGNNQAEDKTVRRVFRAGPRSPWSKLRDKDRDPAFSAIKEKFPARYLQLVEQYYKSFQEEEK